MLSCLEREHLRSTDAPREIEPAVCAGSAGEIGRAQGEAASGLVRACHDSLRELEAFRLLKPSWLPHAVFVRIAERRASKIWRESVAPSTPAIADRARGLARAAGMRVGSLHLMNLLEPLMSDLRDQTVVPPLGGCSAIAISDARSTTGEPIVARNFDYLPLIQPFYMMRDTRPSGGLRSLDFTIAPLAGTADGLNEAGLCITTNYAYVCDDPCRAGTISMAVAETLAKCRTVDEATTFLMARERWGGGILMLADASGDIASLELSNRRARVRRPEAGAGVLFHTNRFHTAAMREVELPRTARFTSAAPTPLRGNVVHDSAHAREARFEKLVSGDRSLSAEDLLRTMADHGTGSGPSNETICMHSDYWSTTATLQFFPRSRRVRVAFDAACRARFTELRL